MIPILSEQNNLINNPHVSGDMFSQRANEHLIADMGAAIFRLLAAEYPVPVFKGTNDMLFYKQDRKCLE